MNIDELLYSLRPNMFETNSVPTVKDQLYKAVMEVIGEDENSGAYEQSSGTSGLSVRDGYQNELRQTQRQRANKFFGRDK